MGHIIGRGRRGGETYPERSSSSGSPGIIQPFVNLAYVDYGTQIPVPSQNGSTATPFGTVQQAIDAGYVSIYIAGYGAEVVNAPGFVYLTGADRNVGLLSLNAQQGAQLDNVFVGTLICPDNCTVFTNATIASATFGAAGFLILNGPGALTFGSKADQLAIENLTMGLGGTMLGTNVVLSSVGAFLADTIELYGSTSVAPVITCGDFLAQNCVITAGTITTTGGVELQDVKCEAVVVFDNAPAQPFRLDGFTNYWIKTNAVALTNPGQKVITDDLVP